MANVKKSKNQLRREKLKLKKQQASEEQPVNNEHKQGTTTTEVAALKGNLSSFDSLKESFPDNSTTGKLFESEMDRLMANPEFQQFRHVFDKFQTTITEVQEESKDKGHLLGSEDESESDPDDYTKSITTTPESTGIAKEEKLSKRKLKQMKKIPLAELKAMAKYPDTIQWYDADCEDPLMNLALKQNKNSIPVPHHWQFKREYLVSRRGLEREQFQLPQYILDTGILNMRDTTKDDDKTLKQKSREKVQPKMNRLDLDYKKLHDAFFKFQTKPRLYKYGDLFYEGKGSVFEAYKLAKYGDPISDELKEALGLGITFDGVFPWVSRMKQYGPPLSYPWVRFFNDSLSQDGAQKQELEESEEKDNKVPFVPFGKLLSYESDYEEREDDDEEEKDEPKYHDDDDDDDQPVIVEESAVEPYMENENVEHLDIPLSDDIDDNIQLSVLEKQDTKSVEPKALYQVLKQKLAADKEGTLNSGLMYELPTDNNLKRKAENDISENLLKKSKTEGNENDEDDEDEGEEKFKF